MWGSTTSSVQSALRSAEELNFSYEAASSIGSADGRCRTLPGRSVLVSAVAGAAVRHRLESATLGRGIFSCPATGAGLTISSPAEPRNGACIVEEDTNTKVEEPIEVKQVQLAADMLSSPDVDIRDAAIKATKKTFGAASTLRKAGDLSPQVSLKVWAGAATALMAETHPPNIRRLVRLLSRVGFHLQGCCLSSPMVNQLWDHLRGLCEFGSDDVHAGALEVMGVVMRLGEAPATEDESGPSCSALRLDEYTSLLEGGVDSAQPVVTRAAVAASLASSGLLKTASTTAAPTIKSASVGLSTAAAAAASTTSVDLKCKQEEVRADCRAGTSTRLWFVALSLLQDDDESVRINSSRACAAAIDHSSSTTAGAGGTAGESALLKLEVLEVLVACETCLFLGLNFSSFLAHWTDVCLYLCFTMGLSVVCKLLDRCFYLHIKRLHSFSSFKFEVCCYLRHGSISCCCCCVPVCLRFKLLLVLSSSISCVICLRSTSAAVVLPAVGAIPWLFVSFWVLYSVDCSRLLYCRGAWKQSLSSTTCTAHVDTKDCYAVCASLLVISVRCLQFGPSL